MTQDHKDSNCGDTDDRMSYAAMDREQRELRISLYAEQHEANVIREKMGEEPVPFTYLEDEPPDNFTAFPERMSAFRLTPA